MYRMAQWNKLTRSFVAQFIEQLEARKPEPSALLYVSSCSAFL